ncbi:hypothetical protein [Marinicrinis lubricantis]|uniref:DUF134 domain-containing protein n=1 Tax=Marinicrinis lubricantis TaxID=2086470 RepID=A0ABW1IM14_9BACL
MDKRQVIYAYRRGLITIQECAQILGIQSTQLMGIVSEASDEAKSLSKQQQSVNS